MLDIGCGDGEHLLRFGDLDIERFGLDVSLPRLRQARQNGLAVLQSTGERLPFPDGSFDLIHVAHVLHHVADCENMLSQIRRCLTRDGTLFVVETVTNHPLIRAGRAIHPIWRGDKVLQSWTYAELTDLLGRAGYRIERSGRYNVLFWMWEMLPLLFWPFEIGTPFFVYLDLLLEPWLSEYAAHCYFVLKQDRLAPETH
jgi:ubiquinone/menaquinone biosynthesis C-methylase UbiE